MEAGANFLSLLIISAREQDMHELVDLGLRCPEGSDPRRIAEGVILSGDPSGISMLWDALLIEGVSTLFEFKIGEKYIVRTLTYYYIGRVKHSSLTTLILEEATCVYDTGKWSTALREGKLNEIEPFIDDVMISASMIVDATIWRHSLPR
jgi:hypothetical protein